MELLQKIENGEFCIKATGTHDANPGIYNNWTDSIGYWVDPGLELTDGKVVKHQVRRIIEDLEGVNIDAKFLSLPNDKIKVIAGKEILFDLVKSTLVPSLMTSEEYEAARVYRHQTSAKARAARWQAMMTEFSNPSVLADPLKIAFLAEELKGFKDDYIIADNKIFESFINSVDHPLAGVPGYRENLDFSTPGKGLDSHPLWSIGGENQSHKDLVLSIIHGCIVHAEHYISE